MARSTPDPKAKLAADLKKQVGKLQMQLAEIALSVSIQKTDAHFYRLKKQKDTDDLGLGKFLLWVDLTAIKETLYVPVSIVSGRKSAGFIYQIEGTTQGSAVATIESKGKEIVTVTSGSISYCKIPAGKIATFKILTEVTGAEGKIYQVVISRINYKLNPNDLRYKRFLTELRTHPLKFK